MTTDKFSEFDRICVDQGLDLVLKSRAILYGMSSNSPVVLISGINIVSFRIWRSSLSCRNDKNPIVLDQYGEQSFIGHRKCGTLWSFSFSCSGNNLSQTLDRIPVRTFWVNEDRPGGLGHTLVNEDDSWQAFLMSHVIFFSLQTLLKHAHREQIFFSPSCLPQCLQFFLSLLHLRFSP